MRSMSFTLTTEQIRRREKTVTRRNGWKNLKPGDRLKACVKCMWLKKDEHPEVLAIIEVVSVRREPLSRLFDTTYWLDEIPKEGFPEMTGEGFVSMFCSHMGGAADQEVTRIEFKYVDEP